MEREQERDDPTPEFDPLQAFHTGKAFYHAGRRFLTDVEIAPGVWESLTWPAAVNFALAAEQFVKALMLLRTGTRPRGHKLDVLFGKLDAEAQKGVAGLYSDEPMHPKIGEDIEEIKDYFDDLRYYHESARRSFWHDPAARFADRLYRYAGSVIEGATMHGDPYP